MEPDIVYRIIIVGDTGVGKSSILLRYTENIFTDQHNVTIGVEFGSKTIDFLPQSIKLQIWDTAGQELFRSIARGFYRKADAVMLVYDITARHTFENCEYWLQEIRSNSTAGVVIILLGNQVDLEQTSMEHREVTVEDGENFAKQNNLQGFLETSAKSGYNIENCFQEIVKKLYYSIQSQSVLQQINGISIRSDGKKKKCC